MDPTEKYFQRLYPNHSSYSRLFFRHGEQARREAVHQWLGTTEGIDILDAGCGDGRFLRSVLAGTPNKVQLEDLVTGNVTLACAHLQGFATEVKGITRNAIGALEERHDLVLAVGILDYQPKWKEALATLILRTRGILIANLPRATHPRNLARYSWLRMNGLHLNLIRHAPLKATLRTIGLPFDLRATSLEWFIKIDCQGESQHAHHLG